MRQAAGGFLADRLVGQVWDGFASWSEQDDLHRLAAESARGRATSNNDPAYKPGYKMPKRKYNKNRYSKQYQGFRKRGYQQGGYNGRFGYAKKRPFSHREMCIEKKFADKNLPATSITETGIVDEIIPDIPIGNQPNERVGQKIFVYSIDIRGQTTLAASTTAEEWDQRVRWAIVMDTQCNGAAPSWGDIYADTNINSFRKLSNTMRFKVLKEGQAVFNQEVAATPGTSSSPNRLKPFKVHLEFKQPVVMNYDTSADTGAIATIRSVNFYLVMCGANASAAATNINGRIRVRFTD